MDLDTLNVKEDAFSIQISHPSIPLFWLRYDKAASNDGTLVLSDFSFSDGTTDIALAGLLKLNKFLQSRRIDKIIVADIAPGISVDFTCETVIRRHDLIVETLSVFCMQIGLKQIDAFLDQKIGKFSTVLLVNSE